jgi:hypothetical protein
MGSVTFLSDFWMFSAYAMDCICREHFREIPVRANGAKHISPGWSEAEAWVWRVGATMRAESPGYVF